jgi:zinc-ribbon domain
MPKRRSPLVCPVCGADIPPGSLACPECGADEKSGWNEAVTRYDGIDLPDGSLDYDRILENEGLRKAPRPMGVALVWWLTGIALLLLIAYWVLRGWF